MVVEREREREREREQSHYIHCTHDAAGSKLLSVRVDGDDGG